MRKTHLLILVLLLVLAGGGLFTYKWRVLGYPLVSDIEAPVWSVQARVSFSTRQGPALLSLLLPGSNEGFVLLDESFVSRGYGLTLDEQRGQRIARWAKRRTKGQQALYYRTLLFPDKQARAGGDRPRFPAVPKLEEPYQTALEAVVDDVRQHSADIDTFTSELLKRMNAPAPDEYLQLLLKIDDSRLGRTRIAQELLAGARIPSQIAWGVRLGMDQRSLHPQAWLEVHNGNRWLVFNAMTAEQGLPDNVLIWWRGDRPMVSADHADDLQVDLSIKQDQVSAMMLAEERAEAKDSMIPEYTMSQLPIQTQNVYSILLMLPLGALVMIFLRNVVGVSTFGTFMPVLVALAFRETHLLFGLLLFVLVVGTGLLFRFYLEKLHLLLVPRLAAVLIIVILIMAMVSLVSHRLGIEAGLSIALFPVVIMSMVIERMSIIWEERGAQEAFIEGAGTLLTATLAYLVMENTYLQHLIFMFPELLLVLLAIALLMGRYTGYRLTELVRFRQLGSGAG
jgi:hypothetical protein